MQRFITRINGFANEELKRKQDQVWKAACNNGWLDMPLYVYSNKDESQECRQARFDGIIAGISSGDVVVVQLPTGNGAKWEQQFVTKIKSYGGRVILFLHAFSEIDSINVPETYGDILYTSNYQEALIVNSFEELEQLRASGLNSNVQIVIREKAKDSTPDAFLTQEYYTLKSLNLAVEAILTNNGGIYKLINENKIRSELVPQFTYAVARESYGGRHAISFAYSGEFDWITVVSEKGVLCETKDSYCHYLLVDSKNVSDTYIIKAYVQTSKGKMLIAESEPIRISKPIVDVEHPKISIIIPAFNAQKKIARTIDHVLAQSQSDIELIVVDDGSADQTVEIVQWYVDKYQSVRLFAKENGGAASARNEGILLAKGEYIGFVDSDDMLPIYSYERLCKAIIEHKTDIVVGDFVRVMKSSRMKILKYQLVPNEVLAPNDYLKYYITEMGNVIWNKLYRANLCKEHLFGPKVYEDMAWTPLIFSYANTILYVNEIIYEWDQTQETMGQRIIKKSREELTGFFRQAIFYYMDNCNPQKREVLKQSVLKNYDIYISSLPGFQDVLDEVEKKY